jgi:hypothetical protein
VLVFIHNEQKRLVSVCRKPFTVLHLQKQQHSTMLGLVGTVAGAAALEIKRLRKRGSVEEVGGLNGTVFDGSGAAAGRVHG